MQGLRLQDLYQLSLRRRLDAVSSEHRHPTIVNATFLYFSTEYTTPVYVCKRQKQPIFQGCLRDISPPCVVDDEPRSEDAEQSDTPAGSITHITFRCGTTLRPSVPEFCVNRSRSCLFLIRFLLQWMWYVWPSCVMRGSTSANFSWQ